MNTPVVSSAQQPVHFSTDTTNKYRHILTLPEHVLEAPGLVNDSHLNLESWSRQNVLALTLADSTYIRRAPHMK